jgi:hypothetical protein
MVCPTCVENETCPDCEKYPHDIHWTPPNRYFGTPTPWGVVDLRTPEMRIAQLERDVQDLKNQVAGLMMKMELIGK